MGREAEKILSSFTFPEPTQAVPNPADNVDMALAKFNEHFVPKRNVIHERAKFHSWQQLPEKTWNNISEHCMI